MPSSGAVGRDLAGNNGNQLSQPQSPVAARYEMFLVLQKGLLELSGGLLTLAKKLSVPVLSDADLLSKVLLPNLHCLEETTASLALEWVASHWEEVKSNEALCDCLSGLRFVKAGHLLAPFHSKGLGGCSTGH